VVLAHEGRLAGPWLAVVPIRTEGDARFELELDAPGDPPLRVRRTLHSADARPLAAGPPGGGFAAGQVEVLLAGRPPARPAPGAPEALDARNLEALRELGYVE
jgi:hypothetical protein